MPILRTRHPVFGTLGAFADADDLVRAIHDARARGYTKMEAYTPLPLHEVTHALGHKNRLPIVVLLGGIVGASGGFFMQWYASAQHYPINVGGRPLNSWPSFIVVTFELTILFAALAAVLGMFAMNGLPQPYHPVFHIDEFQKASQDRFFLLLLSRDPKFEMDDAREFLEGERTQGVWEVPY